MLEAIVYQRGKLQLLEQRKLPQESVFIPIAGPDECWTAIRDMTVRGAPAIGISAALSLAAALAAGGSGSQFGSVPEALDYITTKLDHLNTSRPTAVNLGEAVRRLQKVAAAAAAVAGATPASVCTAVVEAAEAMLEEDVAANKAMGRAGSDALLAAAQAAGRAAGGRLRVLTHCNTGSLATAAFGTALGVIRTLHADGRLEHAYCTETRPYNQGARLTAYELAHDGLPATLVCDSAAAALMAAGKVDAVVVGADRIAANGDTANKIGTYSLAAAAHYHGLPFFVAAPVTTIDPELPSGAFIPIEERAAEEITHFRGQRVAADLPVWNPSFDVTPARLIEGIVTERGPVAKKGSEFAVRAWLASSGTAPAASGAAAAPLVAPGFATLGEDSVRDYVAARPHLAARVGTPEGKADWRVREVGDGNLNFVYILEGPAGGLCVKQTPPYVRVVGESWPLTQDRLRIEAAALALERRLCPEHVPALYHVDERMSVVAMQYLAPPNVVLRRGLIEGRTFPRLADHLASFLARTLFHTSLLALDSAAFRANVVEYTSPEMCSLTEQVIFTDPYHDAPHNGHTSPQLDADVAELRADVDARVAAAELKAKFSEHAQALLHGDLHTGSIMASAETTYVIDPEFAFVGPIAFEVGKILANLLLAFFASDGHATEAAPRTEQRRWLLAATEQTWSGFRREFLHLWDQHGSKGHAYPAALFGGAAPQGQEAQQAAQAGFFATLWRDTVGFMGAVIVRRLVTIARVADFKEVEDADVRAVCERRALRFGRRLLAERSAFPDILRLLQAADDARRDGARPYFPA